MLQSVNSAAVIETVSVSRSLWRIGIRLLIMCVGIFLCWRGAAQAWRAGSARTIALFAMSSDRVLESGISTDELLAPIAIAITQQPADPTVQHARGTLLDYLGQTNDAITAATQAVALRPYDYFLWLQLAEVRDHANDFAGARAAYLEAINLAPYYARPHWQYGNLLLRAGRNDEAFAELRRATTEQPSLFDYSIQLAWNIYKADAQAIESAIQPRTEAQRLALALFYAQQGHDDFAVPLFRTAQDAPVASRKEALRQLIVAKRYPAAYEVWTTFRQINNSTSKGGRITNGGFEETIASEINEFDWQLLRDPNVKTSLDGTRAHSGARSLRLDFAGGVANDARHLSQLVVVAPNAHYRLTFWARTQEIVSIGLPIVSVFDAGGPVAETNLNNATANVRDERLLAQSKTLQSNNPEWQEFTVEFTTPANCEAVKIILQRQLCGDQSCPIFGHIWLDDFSLAKL